MPGSCDVLVIGWPGTTERGRVLTTRALGGWDGDRSAIIKFASPEDLLANRLRWQGRIVWLIVDSANATELYEVLEQLALGMYPVLITRTDETMDAGAIFQSGAIVVPEHLDTDRLQLIVNTMLSQAETISHLKQEVSITRRQHGGLIGQMDKLDEELRLAARVQREFLPTKVPQVGDIDIQVMFRPATYVSGDIYDVQRLDEDHIGLWVADVVGHGVPAALMTMFVKRALPTKEVLENHYRLVPPHEALARLNHEMVNRSSGTVRFATACYALLNCRTHELLLSRAGHPYPMLLRGEQAIDLIESDGPLLGVFGDEAFSTARYQLQPGDRLLIYSDGFETAFSDGESHHDLTRFKQEFAQLNAGTVKQAMTHLEEVIDAQPGSLHQVDDLTVVMIGVKTPAAMNAPAEETPVAMGK